MPIFWLQNLYYNYAEKGISANTVKKIQQRLKIWIGIHRKFNILKHLKRIILLSLINSTIQDVSLKNDIGYDSIEGMLDRYSSERNRLE